MESSELGSSFIPHEVVDVKIEVNPDDVVDDGAKIPLDDEEYIPAPEIEPESSGPSEGDESGDEMEDVPHGLGDMEGRVIHFLAENKKKRKGKCGPRTGTKFKCNKCTSVFRYQSTLDYHKKSECGTKVIKGTKLVEKGNGKISCNVCEKSFCSRTALMVHMRIHTGERPFSCSMCDRSFFQKAHLNDHVANMHSTGYALCRLCNQTFRDKLELSKHMKSHREDTANTFNCQECKETFTSKYQRNQHMTKVHGVQLSNVVRCGICSEPFDTLALLMKHRANAHPGQHRAAVPETGGAVCQECGNKYTGTKQLQAHMRRYHRASLPCPHCPRMLPSKYDLRIHMRLHTGEKPYSCEFCGRSFSRKSVLELHVTLHTGSKDFLCCICGAGFNRKSKLIVHFAEHTNAKFQCKICKREYKCESYLKCHMKTHLGPSKCPCCDQPFLSHRSLVSHIKRFHEEWYQANQKGGEALQEDMDDAEEMEESEEPVDSKDGILEESEMPEQANESLSSENQDGGAEASTEPELVVPKEEDAPVDVPEAFTPIQKEVPPVVEPQLPNQSSKIQDKPNFGVSSAQLEPESSLPGVLGKKECEVSLVSSQGQVLSSFVTTVKRGPAEKAIKQKTLPEQPKATFSSNSFGYHPPALQGPIVSNRNVSSRNVSSRNVSKRNFGFMPNESGFPGGYPGQLAYPGGLTIRKANLLAARMSKTTYPELPMAQPGFSGLPPNQSFTGMPPVPPGFPVQPGIMDDGSLNEPAFPEPEVKIESDDNEEFFTLPGGDEIAQAREGMLPQPWQNSGLTISKCGGPPPVLPKRCQPPGVLQVPEDISIPELVRTLPAGIGIMPPSHTVFLDEPVDYRLGNSDHS